jgi:hypothetical protein
MSSGRLCLTQGICGRSGDAMNVLPRHTANAAIEGIAGVLIRGMCRATGFVVLACTCVCV